MRRNLLIVLFLSIIFLVSCNDEKITAPKEYSLTGQWEFTLSPVDTSDGDEVAHEEIYLYVHENHVAGHTENFVMRGNLEGQNLDLEVFHREQEGDGSGSLMRLHLDSSNSLTGVGSVHHPDFEPVLLPDGSVHPKFEIPNDDWDGGKGGVFFFDVEGRRTGDAPDEKSLLEMFSRQSDKKFTFCDGLSTVASFIVGILTDNLIRPMGSCWLNHVGGGYYLFGHKAPGNILPLWTQTMYYPLEWSWCGTRSYRFKIKIDDETLVWDYLEEIRNTEPNHLDHYSILAHDLADQVVSFKDKYGGFAVMMAYNTLTRNSSFYVVTERHYDREEVFDMPLIVTLLSGVSSVAPREVHLFVGPEIHDNFTLSRSAVPGLCSSPVVFFYLVGSHNVILD